MSPSLSDRLPLVHVSPRSTSPGIQNVLLWLHNLIRYCYQGNITLNTYIGSVTMVTWPYMEVSPWSQMN